MNTREPDDDDAFEEHIKRNFPRSAVEDEIRAVCKKVLEMMKDPVDGLYHHQHSDEQAVRLTLPKAYVYFALYLSLFQNAKGAGKMWQDIQDGKLDLLDRKVIRQRNDHLERVLIDYLDHEFELFATRGHPLLFDDDPDK